jgi:hypothetical protein
VAQGICAAAAASAAARIDQNILRLTPLIAHPLRRPADGNESACP